jgi:methylamine dehydrogenase light chain
MKKSFLDRAMESTTRKLAQKSSRRSVLTGLGRLFLGAAALPLLPIDRSPARAQEHAADQQCDYWRYCAIDGYLCSCCGGSASSCPPGTKPSPTAWVGTCHNPEDDQTYLIAYHDCCGKSGCGRCECWRTEGEMPVYRPQLNNDIIWCFGMEEMSYHCSAAVVVGKATA